MTRLKQKSPRDGGFDALLRARRFDVVRTVDHVRGKWSYSGNGGGALMTGNEDGGKHCAAQML
jgi:hypothetical protein